MARKTDSPLWALMPAIRAGLLTAMLMHPDRWWYLSELARRLGSPASSLQRELAALTAAGILERRRDGNRVYYRADPDCPLRPELQGLIAKTTGLVEVLRAALTPLVKRIDVACVYGSVARGGQDASSDVDLLVIGNTGMANLVEVLWPAGADIGREVNPNLFTPDEFGRKVELGDRFVLEILRSPTLDVIGSIHDLGGPDAPEAAATGPDRSG